MRVFLLNLFITCSAFSADCQNFTKIVFIDGLTNLPMSESALILKDLSDPEAEPQMVKSDIKGLVNFTFSSLSTVKLNGNAGQNYREINQEYRFDENDDEITVFVNPTDEFEEEFVGQETLKYGSYEDAMYAAIDNNPEFPGGPKQMYAFIGEEVVYPTISLQKKESGTVYVSFVVEANGEITHVKVMRGSSESLNLEAKRVIRAMPAFKPGTLKGTPVRSVMNLPIKFSLK